MKQYTIKELGSMGVGKKRSILRELNKIARQRASRLTKAGYSGEMTKPPIVDYSRVPSTELTRAIEDLQIYTRDKRSTLTGMKDFVKSTLGSLQKNGYDFVTKDNLAEFGRFMNKVREIHGAKAFPSNEVAKMYDNMERLGISPRVIETKFKGFLASQEGIADIMETLDSLELPENRKRISSTEVYQQMEELGLI